jgi:hypothetical protein
VTLGPKGYEGLVFIFQFDSGLVGIAINSFYGVSQPSLYVFYTLQSFLDAIVTRVYLTYSPLPNCRELAEMWALNLFGGQSSFAPPATAPTTTSDAGAMRFR